MEGKGQFFSADGKGSPEEAAMAALVPVLCLPSEGIPSFFFGQPAVCLSMAQPEQHILSACPLPFLFVDRVSFLRFAKSGRFARGLSQAM